MTTPPVKTGLGLEGLKVDEVKGYCLKIYDTIELCVTSSTIVHFSPENTRPNLL